VLKFLLTPKWIALTVVALILQPAFWELSQWQWRRLHQRETYNAVIIKNQTVKPASLAELVSLTSGSQTIDKTYEWRRIDITGSWLTNKQVLVRKQTYESNLGFWVITPFKATSGLTILVNRGWIAASDSALDTPAVQNPPTGAVEILGRVRLITARSKPGPTDLPTGQVDGVHPDEVLPNINHVSNSYLELTASNPQSTTSDLQDIPAPEVTEGPHRSYALQWIFFAIMTLIGWGVLVRKEIQVRAEKTTSEMLTNENL